MNGKKLLTLLLLFVTWSSVCFADNTQISMQVSEQVSTQSLQVSKIVAKIIDINGEAIVGVSVRNLKTNDWYFTDQEGIINIDSKDNEGEIEVYLVGYITESFKFTKGANNIFVLELDSQLLEDVVVVGYARQKRENLTGAVESVDGEYFESRPVSNLSKGLQGLVPNLNITMYDGNPSRSPSFNVRGTTSIGAGGDALVLIDGVEGDPAMLNPNDVASISVLKDAASAAIYGSRGTFGVVLITTKNPEKNHKTTVNYSGNFSIYQQTIKPDLVTDGYTWAESFNRASQTYSGYYPTSINSAFPFSQEYLQELQKRSNDPSLSKYEIDPTTGNYIYYDSHDWMSDLYSNASSGMEHNVSLSKSSESTSFLLSARYFEQDGVYRYNTDEYSTFNIRAKGSAKLYKWLEVTNNFDFTTMDYKEPLYYGGWSYTSEISMGWTMRSFPVSPMLNEDGTLTEMGARSIGDLYYGKNKAITDKYTLKNTIAFTATLSDDINIKGDYTFSYGNRDKNRAYSAVPYSNSPGETTWLGDSKYFEESTETRYNAVNLYANYSKKFGEHTLSAIAGLNGEEYASEYFEASRDDLLYPDNPNFSLSNGNNYTLEQSVSDWAVFGVFFRANYSYKDKYLFEANGRYDGSSKFPTDQRWGFFPSISGGWKINEEPFMQGLKESVSLLKLRASYGSLGNGNVDPYTYLETMDVTVSDRIIEGSYSTVTTNPNVTPDNLTWEVARTLNFGLDLGLFNDRFSLSTDIYTRNTLNMFTYGPTLPDVFGAEVPKGNYADMRTNGWELTLSWRDQTKGTNPLKYGVRVVLSDSKSTITNYYNPTNSLSDYYVGMTVGEIWGYETEGLFIDENDVLTHADQSLFATTYTGTMSPGDVKLKDIDGNGVIDYGSNTVDDSGDRTIIGNSSPRYNYGINIDLEWRDFSLSIFGQGVGKRDWYPPAETSLFWGQYNRPYNSIPTQMLDLMYDSNPDNVNPNAYFPRLVGYSANTGILSQEQTGYLQNAAYFRVKNITFSYSIPSKIINRVHISKLNVFFTGQNLFTFSPLFKYAENIDPETIESINPDTGSSAFGGGNSYPILKSYSLGLNVTF